VQLHFFHSLFPGFVPNNVADQASSLVVRRVICVKVVGATSSVDCAVPYWRNSTARYSWQKSSELSLHDKSASQLGINVTRRNYSRSNQDILFNFHVDTAEIGSLYVILLARDVIYTSRAYAMMSVSVCQSVCLWRLCIVVTVCNGSQISLHAWIDGCLCYLLTPGSTDRMLPGFLVEEGRGWKNWFCIKTTPFVTIETSQLQQIKSC